MPSWPSAGGGREQDDEQAVIAVQPPAGHCHSTGQLLQQQTDPPQVWNHRSFLLLSDCTTSTAPYRPHSALCDTTILSIYSNTHIDHLYCKNSLLLILYNIMFTCMYKYFLLLTFLHCIVYSLLLLLVFCNNLSFGCCGKQMSPFVRQ